VIRGCLAEWGTCSRTVLLGNTPVAFSCGNNTIAIGLESKDIIILDVITGGQAAILSEHIDSVLSLAFLPGGTLLVSGSKDKTVKLWDMQTGGVVKTFRGHTSHINSVSISSNCTRIASGSRDKTVRLWDIQTGECKHIIEQQNVVTYVSFSPTNPGHLISISDSKVQEWDINCHKTGPIYNGSHIAFSPDHTKFALCSGAVVQVWNSDSREIVAEFQVSKNSVYHVNHCCFSPDGRFVVAAASIFIYVWDIATLDPYPVETLVGHSKDIASLVFSSSFISASYDKSVKFWQIGVLSATPVMTHPKPTPNASIQSLSLQARDGIAISSDSGGVVKTWDLLTGLCKTSFQTPAKGSTWRDAQLIDGKLIFIWREHKKIHIWDTEKGELLQTLDAPEIRGLRISGDGSKLFRMDTGIMQAWSMWTWKLVGEVKFERDYFALDYFCPGGSKIWVLSSGNLSTQGWDFGISGSSPIPLSDRSLERPHLDLIGSTWWQAVTPLWIKDTATGREVFQLRGRHAKPDQVRWDGQYLVTGYLSGEVSILDFGCLSS